MKIKLNLLRLLFPTREHQLACRIIASVPGREAQRLVLLTLRVADAPASQTGAHLTSWPKNPQMLAPKTTDTPARHFCAEGVTASSSKSDIIGAAIKK